MPIDNVAVANLPENQVHSVVDENLVCHISRYLIRDSDRKVIFRM
jgi:hypothetical protein